MIARFKVLRCLERLDLESQKTLDKWNLYEGQIKTLRGRLGFQRNHLEFLGYVVELESGKVYDKIKNNCVRNPETLFVLLAHYSDAKSTDIVGRLIRFRDLPGGYAYEGAFARRAVSRIAEIFGDKPEMLVEAAKSLNGIKLEHGDSSVEIPALPKTPLVYILWKGDDFPASAATLFDSSASHFLPTEDLAVLAELTTARLRHALERIEGH
jgi:hypothetical protein